MKKELREQIKQDEFATGIEKAVAWAKSHERELRIGVGVAVVLAAVIGGLAYVRQQRAREADRAFREALATWEAPVTAALPPGAEPPSEGPTFASNEDKYKTAAAAFEGIERRHGSSPFAVRAKYYAALARMELKQYADAEKALGEIRGAGLESELARLALAQLYRRSGQVDKAVEAYRGLASNPSPDMPPDYALLNAAQTLEEAKRWREARAAYTELVERYPASLFASQARSRADYLQTAARG